MAAFQSLYAYKYCSPIEIPIAPTYHIAGKFGGKLNLAVWQLSDPQIKISQYFILVYICVW